MKNPVSMQLIYYIYLDVMFFLAKIPRKPLPSANGVHEAIAQKCTAATRSQAHQPNQQSISHGQQREVGL